MNNMWETMTNCLTKDSLPTDEEIDIIDEYIFHHWLSGHPDMIFRANFFNQYNVPIKRQFQFIKGTIGGKIKYVKYYKKEKLFDQELIEIIQEKYKCNQKKASEIYDLLPEDEQEKLRIQWTKHLKARQ